MGSDNLIPSPEEIFLPLVDHDLAITVEQFIRDEQDLEWIYAGALDDVVDWYMELCPDTIEMDLTRETESKFSVHSPQDGGIGVGKDREHAWRKLIGNAVLSDQVPHAQLAAVGEDLGSILRRLRLLEDSLDPEPGEEEETDQTVAIFWGRWSEAKLTGITASSFADWIERKNHG